MFVTGSDEAGAMTTRDGNDEMFSVKLRRTAITEWEKACEGAKERS